MVDYSAVFPVDELPPGRARLVELDGLKIAVFNVAGTLHATEDTCLHAGGPLHEGSLEGSVVTCPWHDWTFDVETGRCFYNPKVLLHRFPVRRRYHP